MTDDKCRGRHDHDRQADHPTELDRHPRCGPGDQDRQGQEERFGHDVQGLADHCRGPGKKSLNEESNTYRQETDDGYLPGNGSGRRCQLR